MIIRRILGFIMLLTGLTILVASLAGMFYIGSVIGELTDSIKNTLTLTTQSLDAARSTLDFLMETTGDVGVGLVAAVDATGSAAATMADSGPLIENVSGVVTQEVPEAVEGIQAALPNIIQVAAVIDNTLSTLSRIGIDRDIPLPFGGSIPLRFDLGIEYNPEIPFDESLQSFQTSLEGLPESLRGLEGDLSATSENLTNLGGDLQLATDNLGAISARFQEITPLLDQYANLVEELDATIAQVDDNIDQQLRLLQLGVIAGLLLLGLTQLAPIYLGWELITGRRDDPLPARPAGEPLPAPAIVADDAASLPEDSQTGTPGDSGKTIVLPTAGIEDDQ